MTVSGTINAGGGVAFGPGATINPGTSPGIINITGTTNLDGLISIELGGNQVDGVNPNASLVNTGTDPATPAFDQINIFGSATLTPGLTIDLASFGGFNPILGDFFDVLTADSFNTNLDLAALSFISSDFNIANFDPAIVMLTDGQNGGVTREALRLTVSSVSSVPVPAAGWFPQRPSTTDRYQRDVNGISSGPGSIELPLS